VQGARWLPWGVTVIALAAVGAVLAGRRGDPAPRGEPLSVSKPGRENVTTLFRDSIALLEARVQDDGSDTTALLALGRLWQDAHRATEAARYYERYVALNAGARQVWLDLADSYAQTGDWTRALRATESLLERFPADVAGMYNAGAIHANLGDSAAAAGWFRRVAGQDRDRNMAARGVEALRKLGVAED
jgi:tetratricopeptide (TPR) repeat protein